MKNDMVEIIGIYQLGKDDIKDFDELLNPENAHNAVIIEMVIRKPSQEIDESILAEITQADDSLPRNNWQAIYDERFLNELGTEVINEDDVREMDSERTRIVFFFHHLDFDKPMQTPFGDVPLKQLTSMPKRLKGKIEYWEP